MLKDEMHKILYAILQTGIDLRYTDFFKKNYSVLSF